MHGGISENIVNAKITIDDLNHYTRNYLNAEHLMIFEKNEREKYNLLTSFKGINHYGGYFTISLIKLIFLLVVPTDFEESDFPREALDKTLDFYDCDQIIVGHKIVNDIKQLHDNKVIGINIRLPLDDVVDDDSNGQMLLIENDQLYTLALDGKKENLN